MFVQFCVGSLLHRNSSDNLITEQFKNLRPQVPTMYVAVFINIMFLAFVSAREIGLSAFILPGLVGGLIWIRAATLVLRLRPVGSLTVAQMRASMTTTLAVAFLLSIMLSVWAVILGHSAAEARSYIALFTALCTICCAACLSSLPLAAYIVVVFGTFPVSVSLMLTGNTNLASMGVNIMLVSPLVVGMIHRQHQQLRRMVDTTSDIAAEKLKVSELAYRDSLTGLPNRRAFLDALADESTGQQNRALAIGMIDLDGFKLINDSYGHLTGDELLVEAAQRFRRHMVGDILIARLGGDEFAVLLRDVERLEDARQRLMQLATAFDLPFIVGEQSFRLRASIGLAHQESSAQSTLSLITRADLAMYEAKRAESAEIFLFKPDMEARTRRRIMVEQALATPAESDLIILHYQPVVDAVTGRIVAFEALARWNHPTLGAIGPSEFIPLAELAGMTTRITMHLLSLALRDASAWPADIGLSFNLSAAELNSSSVASRILELVTEHGFDPSRLSIEVTETAMLRDFEAARCALSAMRDGGIRILLDDFGAGFASIGYLREIQFDGIKLDGSLIAPMLDSPAAHDLLVGVLHLCRAIGAPVTAEMVESGAQRDMLRDLGGQTLQGYFLSKPLAAEQALQACQDDHLRMPKQASPVTFKKLPCATGTDGSVARTSPRRGPGAASGRLERTGFPR